MSRVLKEKGTLVYFEATKKVKGKYPDTEFVYIGMIDKNKNAISLEALKPYVDAGSVKYVPETDDVKKYVSECSVFVLPTYYREGVPRTLLEATAMGRPIITTYTPGCKDTVVDGVNGLFVKEKQVDDLAEKMIWMIEHEKELQKMGDESYNICLEKFAVEKVNKRMLEIMGVE